MSEKCAGKKSRPLIVRVTFAFIAVLAIACCLTGCNTLAKKGSTGVVVARRAQIRSSTAVVAANLLEVARNDQVDILDTVTVQDTGEKWLRVRGHDEENTEGWIEARNVMLDTVLESSVKLRNEDKDTPAQATGQLHASSNLRLSPDRASNDNIMMKLDSGSTFEIVGWKRVPKPGASETIESDIAPKPGSGQTSSPKGKKDSDAEKEPEEPNELWYKVRLPPSSSPAPAGWIYGKQVELTVPSDIIFYRTGREFVAWHRIDDDGSEESDSGTNKGVQKETKPGSWVILEKSGSSEPRKLDEPDFDRIYVLGYDKHNQEHYTGYRSPDLQGFLPLRVEGRGANKTFTIRVKEEGGQVKDAQYSLYRDDRGVLRVAAPGETPRSKKRK
ncbi:MAG: hypothetical protein QOE77_1091 [Blastocatellia bacterium]|jgi:hypothetical protein|nr:hypothetical protein [Blastocatellia bacterium]